MRIADLLLNNRKTRAVAKLDTYKNILPHAKLITVFPGQAAFRIRIVPAEKGRSQGHVTVSQENFRENFRLESRLGNRY